MSAKIETQNGFEQRLATLAASLGKQTVPSQPAMPTPEQQSGETGSPAEVVQQLVGVAAQLARVDKTIAQVAEGAPDADDAKHWHQLSLQALQCSRSALVERQSYYLKILGSMVGEATPKAGDEVAPSDVGQKIQPPGLAPPPGLAAPQPSAAQTPSWKGWTKETVDACPEFVPQQSQGPDAAGGGSLRQDLQALRDCQPECVMIVRKIKKLGFESPTFLNQHFQQFGNVSDVLVAHSTVKPTAKRPTGRVRPAALGFVVMADASGVESALQAGETQMVAGTAITVSKFNAFGDFEEEDNRE